MSIGKKLRFSVLSRDKHCCTYCGLNAGVGVQLQVDHIIPKSKGGLDSIENLTTACFECNIGKGATLNTNDDIWKDKIKNNVKVQKSLFYKYWNDNRYGTIDDDTRVLLGMQFDSDLGGNIYHRWIDYPPLYGIIGLSTEDRPDSKILLNNFKKGAEYCDAVINVMNQHSVLYISEDSNYDGLYISDLRDDYRWSNGVNFVDRLNYILGESLYDECIQEGKSTYHLMKFCRFYNQIKSNYN